MSQIKYLLWVDLETTGTEENGGDEILEVAAILTRANLEIASEAWPRRWVVQPGELGMLRLRSNDYVFKMHRDNGLLVELDQGLDIMEVDKQLGLAMLDYSRNPKREIRLAGSGVGHFDSRFIKRWMPAVHKMLPYAHQDIGNMRRFAIEQCGFEPPDFTTAKSHRALDDVQLHLAEARWWRTNLMGLFERISK